MLKFKSSIDTKDHRYSENGEGGRKLAEEGGRKQCEGRRLVGSGVWQSVGGPWSQCRRYYSLSPLTIRLQSRWISISNLAATFLYTVCLECKIRYDISLFYFFQTIRGNNQTSGGAQPVIFRREEAANKETTDGVGLGSSAAGLGASASSPVFAIYRDEIGGGRS
nr:hypothetical protein Iba_chr01dCG6410 [Ipomoea batatas]